MSAHFEQTVKEQAEHNRRVNARRRWLSAETRSWLVGYSRAGVIFGLCFGIALLSRQYPKFYFHAVFAVVAAAVFGGLAWLFRPRS